MIYPKTTPDFRCPGKYPGHPLLPSEAEQMIIELRDFLGRDSLAAATRAYHRQVGQVEGIRLIRLQQQQPLIAAFEMLNLQTWGGHWPLRILDPALLDLANVAALGRAVIPTLDEAAAHEHRHKLLDIGGQLKPLVLEWNSAAQLIKSHQAEIAWCTSGRSAPEFVARANGVEFEVECKWVSTMFWEAVRGSEGDMLATAIFRAVRGRSLCGYLNIEFTRQPPKTWGLLADEATSALQMIEAYGVVDMQLASGERLMGNLWPYGDDVIPASAWKQYVLKHQLLNALTYGFGGKAAGDNVTNPLIVQITSERKSIDALAEQLWARKFDKAARQCTKTRGAILVAEWEAFEDPETFVKGPIFGYLLNRTYAEHKHVASVVMRCNNPPVMDGGIISNHVRAYSTRSAVTDYPEVTRFMSLHDE